MSTIRNYSVDHVNSGLGRGVRIIVKGIDNVKKNSSIISSNKLVA